jgi:hypothetical protein
MSISRAFYHTVKADFLERIRSYGFLIVLLLTMLSAYVFVPGQDAGYMTLKLSSADGFYRGVYNSAWIGAMVSLPTTLFLALFGYYVVKNAVERDRRTGVGQIIATTPISKPVYMLGKAASNFAVLAAIVGVMMIGALAMQLFRGETGAIDLWALWSPFLLLTLPAMAVVASVSVLFESIGLLRGGFGNVAYFIFYMIVMVALLTSANGMTWGNDLAFVKDMLGTSVGISSIEATAKTIYPGFEPGHWSMGFAPVSDPPHTFVWNGIEWTPLIVMGRLFWVLVACGIALIASVFFDRFDSAGNAKTKASKQSSIMEPLVVERPSAEARLTSLPAGKNRLNVLALFIAELKLAFKGQKWWWYAGAAVIIVFGLISPSTGDRHIATLAAMVWPMLVWSSMGTREQTFNTAQIVFSAPGPVKGQLPITWLSGVCVGIVLCSGIFVSMALAGSYGEMATLFAEMLLIPAMALAMGIWSGSSKLFEALYLILWYVGPVNGLPFLDLTGTIVSSMHIGLPAAYLAVTVVFMALMVTGRHRQSFA